MATVDQSSIRGSKPHERLSSRAYLGLSSGVGMNRPMRLTRITLTVRPAPGRTGRNEGAYSAAGFTSWPIAHTKPESSRAIAATTTVGLFPLALSARNRWQRRN
jgi:hypothetical protein